MSGLRVPADGPIWQDLSTTDLPGGSHDCWSAKKLDQHGHSSRISAKILAQRAIKRQLLAIVSMQGELFRARTHIRASRVTNIARRTQKHGDGETTITTARPQQGNAETAITSAPEKRAKNAYFSPAKAMAVSIPRRNKRAKATMVSDNRATWPTGLGRGTCGR